LVILVFAGKATKVVWGLTVHAESKVICVYECAKYRRQDITINKKLRSRTGQL
jgi:hypothetical protein